jgi:hypothetical protein
MKPQEAVLSTVTDALLAMTLCPYDEYNTILPQIKKQLALINKNGVATFEKTLFEELPLTTARRAYQTAIRVALGQDNVFREYVPPQKSKSKKKSIK